MARSVALVLTALLLLGSFSLLPGATAAEHRFRDVTIRSFDGTPIQATVFTPANATPSAPVPYVLMTHGWAGSRVTEPTGRVADLLDAGYGVLTWDSRGFGASGGEVQLNSPDFEVKDVQVILSWLAANVPEALEDGPNDPRVGMSGGSYAGGIQLLAAAFDERIDVIAPEITWNDLVRSLGPNGVPKLYWTSLLLGAGQAQSCRAGQTLGYRGLEPSTGCQTSDLARYYAMVHATGTIPAEVEGALRARSPATYIGAIDTPTLLVQGIPDTLFDADEAIANYQGIKANGAPVKLWLYDGGHGRPETPGQVPNTQGSLISDEVITWFDRHLKGDATVDTGAEVEYYDGRAWHEAAAWPVPGATTATLSVRGLPTLPQGPVAPDAQSKLRVRLTNATNGTAVGGATVGFNVTGSGAPEGFLFLALERTDASGTVRLGGQVQPVRFPVSGRDARVEVDLVDVVTPLAPGDELWLTLATWDRDFSGHRAPALLNVHDVDIRWMTV